MPTTSENDVTIQELFSGLRAHLLQGSVYGLLAFVVGFPATSVLAWGDLLIYGRIDVSGVPQQLGAVFFGDLFINPGGYAAGLLLPPLIYTFIPLFILIIIARWFVLRKSAAGEQAETHQDRIRQRKIGIGLALVPGYVIGYLLLHTFMISKSPAYVLNQFGLWLAEFPFEWGVAMPTIAGALGGYFAS